MIPLNFTHYQNFNRQEFTCHCGCKLCNPAPQLLKLAQKARNIIKLHCQLIHQTNKDYPTDIPIIVTRGSSCQEHNDSIKNSSPTSSHIATETIQSTAMDIKCHTSQHRFIIIEALLQAGFNRIGLYKKHNGIHVDCDTTKTPYVMWLK